MNSLDDHLTRSVASGAHVGGVAIAATAEEVVHEAAFGTLTAGGDAVPADQLFRIASMTKAMTTAAVLHLVDAGRLDLDAELSAVTPKAEGLQVLEGFDGDTPRLRPPARQPLVRELLNHTAGFGYSFLNADLARFHELTGLPSALVFASEMLDAPMVNDPGVAWEYGTNTDWAGHLVEVVSGQDLDAYLREHVWEPLGMARTTFRAPADADLMPMHQRLEDGSLVASGLEFPNPPAMCSGGGGAYSTAGDYARFMRMLLRGGELDGTRVLSPEAVELMFTPSLGDLALPEGMRTADPLLSNDVPAAPYPEGWGLGLHLTLVDLPGMRRSGTGDWAGLPNCFYWVDRAAGVCGAVLTQVLPFFDLRIVETALGYEAGVYAQLGAAAPA